jgi:tetratricopeptide (TPR) repeat protein/predicted aspartyl protease
MLKPTRVYRGLRGCLPNSHRAAWTFGLMLCAACAPALAGPAKCKLGKLIEFPVTMHAMAPEIIAKINGTDVRLALDSGAFYSSLDAGSAAALGLRVYAAPDVFSGKGVGGGVVYSIAKVKELTLPPALTLHDVEFAVGGSHLPGQEAGVLGRNILQLGDAEYDFASGVARLMKPEDCSDTVLAYWLRPGDSYSVIKTLKPEQSLQIGSHVVTTKSFQHPAIAVAYVNGMAIRALFDTGASTSFLSVKAAAKAGIKIDSPGVVSGGYIIGVGRSTVQTYLAPVALFKLGDEEIRNTRLRVGEMDLGDADMLIGADFFLSHHVYVANSQDKLYFSYNGGPVFNLATQQAAGAAPSAAAAAAEVPGPVSSANAKEPVEDASEYARRGAALGARQELDQALQAFNRACELAPDKADYFYQRALLYAQLRQPGPALADLDRTIQIDPHHVAALLARAEYRTRSGDKVGAEADLDAANAVLPKEDGERLTLASEYLSLDLFQRAIEQYDLWSASHPQDVRLPLAFNGRCRAHALGNMDLQHAMKDCDIAIKHATKGSPFYAEASASRGLLWFRLGDYDKSIADYDASLKIDPKSAFALYGRGIDELRKQKTPQGQADIARATTLSAKIADNFNRYGIAR